MTKEQAKTLRDLIDELEHWAQEYGEWQGEHEILRLNLARNKLNEYIDFLENWEE